MQDYYIIRSNEFIIYAYVPILKDKVSLEKTIETIEKYGLKGYSKGKQNGIFFINTPGDNALLKQLLNYLDSKKGQEFLREHKLDKNNLDNIKIVTHRDDGKRAIGFKKDKNIYLVKVGNYKK